MEWNCHKKVSHCKSLWQWIKFSILVLLVIFYKTFISTFLLVEVTHTVLLSTSKALYSWSKLILQITNNEGPLNVALVVNFAVFGEKLGKASTDWQFIFAASRRTSYLNCSEEVWGTLWWRQMFERGNSFPRILFPLRFLVETRACFWLLFVPRRFSSTITTPWKMLSRNENKHFYHVKLIPRLSKKEKIHNNHEKIIGSEIKNARSRNRKFIFQFLLLFLFSQF